MGASVSTTFKNCCKIFSRFDACRNSSDDDVLTGSNWPLQVFQPLSPAGLSLPIG